MDKIYNEILKILDKAQVYLNEPMSKHTTFRIGGSADIFVKLKNINELKSILELAKKENVPVTIVGNGSNLLVKDRRNRRYSCKT